MRLRPGTVDQRFERVLENAESLVELKLASGISAPHRLKDLADVLEIVRAAKLPMELAADLNPYVRDKYVELWHAAQVEDPE